MSYSDLKTAITHAAQKIVSGDQASLEAAKPAIHEVMSLLDEGKIRVATPTGEGTWTTHAWIKEAILLYFKIAEMKDIEVGPFTYRDKIPLKSNFAKLNVRVVPPATARYGTFMEPGVVLMPSYVNIGAYIGAGTMVDTWATVGSCAQIGRDVHLSGGVGIGGVLEPPNASPVIIGDGAFIGSRAIVVEGVEVGNEAVLAANVTITASTPIIDARPGQNFRTLNGRVPERAVVVPGTREKEIPGGKIQIACAYIIGDRLASTDRKTSLNSVLREFAISV